MTDHLDPDDELASALLDGAATPEELARAEADPALQARVDDLRRVREQLRAAADADPAVDPGQRDAAIAAALDAFDDPLLAEVSPLVRPGRRHGLLARVVGAVAAVALVAAVIPALTRLSDGDGSDDTSTAGAPLEEDGAQESADDQVMTAPAEGFEQATTDAALGESGGASTTARAASPAPADLGTFPDAGALADAVRSRLAAPPAAPPSDAPPTPEVAECVARATDTAAAAGAAIVLAGVAVVDDQGVVVTVVEEPDGIRTLTVADPARGCALVSRTVL